MTEIAVRTTDLRAAPPPLHGDGEYWGLGWPALAWLERNVEPGMATLETGAGASTMIFAAGGAEHEAITPAEKEARRIREACRQREIDTGRVRFRIGSSHRVLAEWTPRPLDLVLIDGAHGFPYPILDWWYLAPHVRVGGQMLIDDAYMPPVGALLDHLEAHRAWEVVEALGYRTVLVRKLADELPDFDWHGEPIGRGLSFHYLPPDQRVVAAVRHRVFSTALGLRAVGWARSRRRKPVESPHVRPRVA